MKFGEFIEHIARYKDKDGKDMHGGGHALAQGKPAADLVIPLMKTVPRLIREIHKELIKEKYWKYLCIRADQRVKHVVLEKYLKTDFPAKEAFAELIRLLRSVFNKAPRWMPEDMKYFLNAVSNGPHRLRGVAGMGPVVDLLINLAWHEVRHTRYLTGWSAAQNPVGVFIPSGRSPDRLDYVEYELQQVWVDMWEWPED